MNFPYLRGQAPLAGIPTNNGLGLYIILIIKYYKLFYKLKYSLYNCNLII